MSFQSRIPAIVAQSTIAAERAVQRAGFAIEAGAKRRARVDTGFMRGAIEWQPDGPLSGAVVAGAEYTIHHEYGTAHMSAQPMLVPAAEEARAGFLQDMGRAYG